MKTTKKVGNWRLTAYAVFFIRFILVDNLSGSLLVIERMKDFIETRIALFVIEEIDEGHDADGV